MHHRRWVRGLLVIGLLATLPGKTSAQPHGHGGHPPMPNQKFYLQCRLESSGGPEQVEAAVDLTTPSAASELNQVVDLPPPLKPIRVMEYLPRAIVEQEVIASPLQSPLSGGTGGGVCHPAIQISIDGPTQSHQRWLLAGDTERNRLISFIGRWRYMAVADKKQRDDLFVQFKTESTRPPKLIVSRMDRSGAQEVPVKEGLSRSLDELGCRVTVRRFFPHFAMDNETGKPTNLSKKRLNPAVLVDITYQGIQEQRWAFAKFPKFSTGEARNVPIRVMLDCPVDDTSGTPNFALVTTAARDHEVWTRHEGKITARPLALDDAVAIVGSQYNFRVTRFVASGRLVERYRPVAGARFESRTSESRTGVPALKIEITDDVGKRTPLWLELGRSRVISTPKGPLTLAFSPRRTAASGGH